MDNNNSNNNQEAPEATTENLTGVAGWVSAAVVSAFFSSLERFSCVNVATFEPDNDDEDEEEPDAHSPAAPSRDSSNLPV